MNTLESNSNRIYITAILPAHNESKGITPAINSIRPYVNKIIVACDNCSDDTAQKAVKAKADTVFDTKNNHHRKAGALNQALTYFVDWNIPNQYFLIMDADTVVVNPYRWFFKAKNLIYPNRPKISREARFMSKAKRWKLKLFHRKKYNKLFKDKAYDCVGSIFQAPT